MLGSTMAAIMETEWIRVGPYDSLQSAFSPCDNLLGGFTIQGVASFIVKGRS